MTTLASTTAPGSATGQTTELLTALIRNRCVNAGDGTGTEAANVATLTDFLDGSGVDLETYEAAPGRGNLVARIDGSDPNAPVLALVGHTDVVPANASAWREDPFGGEVIDGEVWGRGAIDMLGQTAAMAVALRALAASGFAPEGGLVFAAVADEESGGRFGAKWLADHHWPSLRCTHAITEFGGIPMSGPAGLRYPVATAEKGAFWLTVRVRGTGGHGAQPYRTDNALVTGAEVIRRLDRWQPAPVVTDAWRSFIEGMGFTSPISDLLTDEGGLDEICAGIAEAGRARLTYCSTHPTISPNVAATGDNVNVNVIPDTFEVGVDVRTLPDDPRGAVELVRDALGELAELVEIDVIEESPATSSPTDGELWKSMRRTTESIVPAAAIVPLLLLGSTDAPVFRQRGIPCYGYGLYSERLPSDAFFTMFHGNDERIDCESLGLSVELWQRLAVDFLATGGAHRS